MAKYPPNTGPQSRSPRMLTEMGRNRVSANPRVTSAITATSFPSTSCSRGMGRVSNTSIVPTRCSSLHWRMVSVATRKIITTGIHWKRGRMSAMLRAKNASTQKKRKKVTTRNTPTKIRASGEPK